MEGLEGGTSQRISISKSLNGRPAHDAYACFLIPRFLVPVFLIVAATASKALSYAECHFRRGNCVAMGSKACNNLCAAVLPACACCCLSTSGIAAADSAFSSYRISVVDPSSNHDAPLTSKDRSDSNSAAHSLLPHVQHVCPGVKSQDVVPIIYQT